MTREDEKLKAKDDNAQLALEFTKEFNECIEKQVPKECAALAVLHDLADWKDKHPRKELWNSEKVVEWILNNYGTYEQTYTDNSGNHTYSDFQVGQFIRNLREAMED